MWIQIYIVLDSTTFRKLKGFREDIKLKKTFVVSSRIQGKILSKTKKNIFHVVSSVPREKLYNLSVIFYHL